jgi:DNA repair protein RadC
MVRGVYVLATDPAEEYRPTIHDLPADERPRERLEHRGEAALSNVELLAILLRTGMKNENVLQVAGRLLAKYRTLGGLARAGFSELAQERGFGAAKVAQLKAALELGRRCAFESPEARPQVTSPASAANLLQGEMAVLEQEHLRTLLLDTKNRVLDIKTISVGSLNANHVRIGELFREAIKANCASIIVAPTHPS